MSDITPSEAQKNLKLNTSALPFTDNSIYRNNNIFLPKDSLYFDRRYRFGVLNTYQSITTAREYLFFTKPDLNIISRDSNGTCTNKLNETLNALPYWSDLYERNPEIICMLQSSWGGGSSNGTKYSIDPFNNLLGNMVQSNLDVPSTEAQMIDTPTNMYGVGYQYRSSSEASDDNPKFSLEFKDTKYLPVYNFFRAYDQYEVLKHHGQIAPYKDYIKYKILHDAYSIYKFIVGEDGETILYYGKYYGVTSRNVPREAFNNTTYDNGLSYSIDFDAAFYEDMTPEILADFNAITAEYYNTLSTDLNPYNSDIGGADTRPGKCARVVKCIKNVSKKTETQYTVGFSDAGDTSDTKYTKIIKYENPISSTQPGNISYKLKWKC